MEISYSNRISQLPKYLFAKIDELKVELQKKGKDVIDLGIGDPDMPADESILNSLNNSMRDRVNHRYPSYGGLLSFRNEAARFMSKRFSVDLDPVDEFVSLIGSKEGIAHFPLAFVDPGDVVLCPEPGYPVYSIGTIFAGGEPFYMPLLEKNKFLPDLNIPEEVLKKTKIIWVNYPNNPTSVGAPVSFFMELVEFARKNEIIVCHDCAYSEIYTGEKPISIFNIPGAKDVSIEFHSLSKTFNMTGFRIGFACGNKKLVSGLGKIKTNIDSGIFQAIQYAGIEALRNYDNLIDNYNKVYSKRRELVVSGLKKLGFRVVDSKTTFYVWARVPEGFTSESFSTLLLREASLIVTPGNGFGKSGEGYFRIALNQEINILKSALARISEVDF